VLIINFVLFQLAWFACVIGAAQGLPWLGVGVTLLVLAWHFFHTKQRKYELILILSALIIGAFFDQFLLSMQWVNYQAHGWSSALVPAWILALWVAFASTLNLSLAWMQGRYLISVLFGASGGPLAYFGAQNIGAVHLPETSSYLALGIGWAIITPALLYIASRLNQPRVNNT
jgi:hypothetical protein